MLLTEFVDMYHDQCGNLFCFRKKICEINLWLFFSSDNGLLVESSSKIFFSSSLQAQTSSSQHHFEGASLPSFGLVMAANVK